jgi:predicted porin
MKKSLPLLALLGLAASAAQAQTALTIYGIADVGVVREYGRFGPSITKLDSGLQSGSRLGFKGTEDLGGGMKALFVLETGLQMDTGGFAQGGLAFGRQSYVGIDGGFGTLTLGRQNQSQFIALDSIDPFGTGLAGTSTNLFAFPNGIRNNNMIMYASPTIGGFSGELQYAFGEVAGNASAGRNIGGAFGYAAGPLQVKLSYEKENFKLTNDSNRMTMLSGGYDFSVAQLAVAYQTAKNDSTRDETNALIGVTVPFGASAVMASYIRHRDRALSSGNANQIALGYTYALSKRTNLYSSYARIGDTNSRALFVGNATGGGSNNTAFNVGIRHKF